MAITQLQSARVQVDVHERFCAAVLRGVGVREDDAATVGRALATTDAWGTFTHGIKCLPGYRRRLAAGGLRATAVPTVVSDGPSWSILDGGSALGAVTAVAGIERAIAKARQTGIAYVGVRNSCHFGAAGYYATLAAEQGLIGIAMANDAPSMAITGARGRIIGNNPFAFALPCAGQILMLDMALSTVAGGKVMAAAAYGRQIPTDWLLDPQGRPTTDPNDFLAGGTLTPMGGHKGYGLAVMVEALSAALTGAATLARVGSWVLDDPTQPTGHGAAFIALDVQAIAGAHAFAERMATIAADLHRAPPAAGVDRVWLPGEMEWRRRQQALREGIVLPPDVVAAALGLAEHSGIALDLTPIAEGAP